MDDEALITHHGSTDLPAATDERPLVTFALFAFNQERYIREAIEGAFAQTYSPLEIILTDDCSSDSTPSIMEEMAAAYCGPHRIVVRRGLRNVGTLTHVLYAARMAQGEFLVVAAGDDISVPERVGTAVSALVGTDFCAFSSDEFIIDENGEVRDWYQDRFSNKIRDHQENPGWVGGATAAYRTSLFKGVPIPDQKVLFEDIFISDLIWAQDKTSVLSDKKLIYYRVHSENLFGNQFLSVDLETQEANRIKNWGNQSKAKVQVLNTRRANPQTYFNPSKIAELMIEQQFNERMANWQSAGLAEKVQGLFYATKVGRPWAYLARIFGKSLYFQSVSLKGRVRALLGNSPVSGQ
jgi:glycosyltransferase involved in cell wall biosynthesis